MRKFIFAVALLGSVTSPAVNAKPQDCRLLRGTLANWVEIPGVETYTIDGYVTPEFNPSVPTGTVIDSREVTTAGNDVRGTCSLGVRNVYNGKAGAPPVDPIYHTYPTTVKGIGVRLRYVGGSAQDWWPFAFSDGGNTINVAAKPIRIEFVKTGPVTAQGTLRGEIGGIWLRDMQFQMVSFQIAGGIQIRPKVPTCAVATKRINVQLSPSGDGFTTRDFNGVGSTTPERDFSIVLNCSGGDEGTSTNAYVTLTDNSNNGNRSDRLSLTPDSDASGVAVQVLRGGTPLSFGPDSSSANNPNQWKAGTIPQGMGVFAIPLTARYIQTNTKMKGGMANAVATFTMSYQ
ncbi:fimbria adhesin protein [Burkholderia lata]|uniref:fimbrial protein n=1 Tax=Burkholderia lata (strain ATCC 17760 / DSM 23089 / LMG 22485 / NCIMB 9086 / R18194 / 383) TaxID=482957 RepID=UPI001453BD2F|nr:fimbrial protein [Burkholderia lata]VWC77349.1 fimbria adhesin protein [Burkholderia lata]